MKLVATFTQQMEAMYERLEHLYAQVGRSTLPSPELFPIALKELGVAAEELQVATEELHQQNHQMLTSLEDIASKCRYYQNLLNQLPEAHFVTDLDGKIQEANLAAAQLLQLEPSLLVGKLLVSFVPVENRALFRAKLNQLPRLSHPQVWSAWLQPRHKEPLSVVLTTASGRDGNSETTSLHWIVRRASDLWTSAQPIQPPDAAALMQQSAAGVGTEEIAVLLSDRPYQTYMRGEVVSLSPGSVWVVRQGVVKVTTLTENAEEVLLGLVGSGMPFGVGSGSLPVYQAAALTETQLVCLPLTEVQHTPCLARALLPKFHQRVQQMEVLLHIAGQRYVSARLQYFLRLLKREIGQTVPEGTRLAVRLTHEEIANACCSTRVTITRLLGELQRQDKIAFDAKQHIILKPDF